MVKKIMCLVFLCSALLIHGCTGRTLELQQIASKGTQQTLFDELELSTIYMTFHQNSSGVFFDEIRSTPFHKEKIAKLYKQNAQTIESETNNELSGCLQISSDGKVKQCFFEIENSIFYKNSPKFMENPVEGTLEMVTLPLCTLMDVLNFDAKGTQTMRALTEDVLDKEAMSKYGAFLVNMVSADYGASKTHFNSYKKFLQETALINLANENVISQLRSFGSKEAYDLAYDISLSEKDLKRAYTSVREINAFLAKPHQVELDFGSGSNCFTVECSSLNIRTKPSTKRSKIVGRYVQKDIVCPLQEKNNWIKSDRGWVSKKYLGLSAQTNKKNLVTKVLKLKKLKRNYVRQNSLKLNSIAAYESYIKTYGKEKKIRKNLQALYRNEGQKNKSAGNFQKSYQVAANEVDVTNFIKYSNLQVIRDEYTSPSFVTDHNHRSLLKAALIERLRALDTLEGYTEAYRYSESIGDLAQILDRTTTVKGLETFLVSYKDKKIISSAKRKLVALYRVKDSFADYLSAYELLSENVDAEKALAKARSSHEKALVEKAVFENIANKDAFVVSTLTAQKARYSDDESNGGFLSFSQHSFSGAIYPRGRVGITFKKNTAFRPAFGKYKVTVTVLATVPRYKQLRSKWLGNQDTTDDAHNTHTITLTLKPPYNSVATDFNMGETGFVYFDRGSSGGYTAKWPSDNAYLSVKNISVQYVGESSGNPKDLRIDFKSLSRLRTSPKPPKVYVDGSYSKGAALISKFDGLDDQKINSYRSSSSYASTSSYSGGSSSSSASSNRPSSSSSSKSSPKKSSGVKETYDGGYKSSDGHPIYIVRCIQGLKFSAFKRPNGYWFDGSGSNYGTGFRNLSLDQFAAKKCSY